MAISLRLESGVTAVAVGSSYHAQHSNAGNRTCIVQVATGFYHTVSPKIESTMVAGGWNDHGQCNLVSWRNMAQLATG